MTRYYKQSAENHRIFPLFFPNAIVKTIRVQINAIQFIFIEADIRKFEIRIIASRKHNQTTVGKKLYLGGVAKKRLLRHCITRIGDTFPHGFPQTVKVMVGSMIKENIVMF